MAQSYTSNQHFEDDVLSTNDEDDDKIDRKREVRRIRKLIHSDNDKLWMEEVRRIKKLLKDAAFRVSMVLDQLERANTHFGGLIWEYDWERLDMLEDLRSMRQTLREGIAESSLFNSQIQIVLNADAREIISDLEAALRAERSKNWELSYYARDIEEDKWKLQVRLRDSVPAQDGWNPRFKAKTAMERVLEMEIAELRETIRNPKGRGRSKSV